MYSESWKLTSEPRNGICQIKIALVWLVALGRMAYRERIKNSKQQQQIILEKAYLQQWEKGKEVFLEKPEWALKQTLPYPGVLCFPFKLCLVPFGLFLLQQFPSTFTQVLQQHQCFRNSQIPLWLGYFFE